MILTGSTSIKVFELPGGLENGMEAAVKFLRQSAKDRLVEIARVFKESGLPAETITLEGYPLFKIMQYTPKERVD